MLEKVRNFANQHINAIKFGVPASSVPVVLGSSMIVNAQEPSGSGNVTAGMTSALQSAFANVQADVVAIVTTALPYALGIMGLMIAILAGLRFFKRAAK